MMFDNIKMALYALAGLVLGMMGLLLRSQKQTLKAQEQRLKAKEAQVKALQQQALKNKAYAQAESRAYRDKLEAATRLHKETEVLKKKIQEAKNGQTINVAL